MDEHMSDTRTWLREGIDGRLAAGVGVAWLVLMQIAFALEPTTHQPEPSYGIALELTMWLLLATMVAGLVMQRRAGLVASLAAAGFFTALSVACPVSGHHPFGAWWFGQMACALGLVAVSVVALGMSTARTPVTRRGRTPLDAPAAPDAPAHRVR
jgi:peptidoglycan/LPS O-acetylase OafA/YrhL